MFIRVCHDLRPARYGVCQLPFIDKIFGHVAILQMEQNSFACFYTFA